MERRPFGSTKCEVPVIGQGTWYGEDDDRAAAIAALRVGLDLGMAHIDTAEMYGDGHLSAVELVNNKTGETRTIKTPALFSFIGAVPRTDWLPPEVERDERGFVRTGLALAQTRHWMAKRQPFLLEASRRGVFAAGDMRAGSVKRVASRAVPREGGS